MSSFPFLLWNTELKRCVKNRVQINMLKLELELSLAIFLNAMNYLPQPIYLALQFYKQSPLFLPYTPPLPLYHSLFGKQLFSALTIGHSHLVRIS